MRILFIPSDNNPSSGAFLSMTALARILKDEFDVEAYIVLPREGKGVVLLDEAGLPHKLIPSFDWVMSETQKQNLRFWLDKKKKQIANISAVNSIVKLAKELKIDIIHINTTYAYVGMKAGLRAKIPVVWHLREFLEEDQGRTTWNRNASYKLINKATQIVTISSSLYDKYAPYLDKCKLKKILNGIDTDIFYKPLKKILEGDNITFVYGGGYVHQKGVYEMISAFSLLHKFGMSNFKLLLIGKTNAEFRNYVKKNDMLPYVQYLGYQKDVADIYEKTDIALNCSACEAFGRKTVEAMLSGNLVIGSNTGGTLDIITHNETGLLYQQGNPIDLAHKLMYAIKHKEQMRSIAEAGRSFAYNNMSAQLNAANIYSIYKDVVRNSEN